MCDVTTFSDDRDFGRNTSSQIPIPNNEQTVTRTRDDSLTIICHISYLF